jgi:hypothetical protein
MQNSFRFPLFIIRAFVVHLDENLRQKNKAINWRVGLSGLAHGLYPLAAKF